MVCSVTSVISAAPLQQPRQTEADRVQRVRDHGLDVALQAAARLVLVHQRLLETDQRLGTRAAFAVTISNRTTPVH